MDDLKKDNKVDLIPEVHSAISFLFEKNADVDAITDALKGIGITDIRVRKPKNEPYVCFDFAIIHNEPFWELNDALTKMFSKVDGCLPQLKDILARHKGKSYIDIAFYQYGTYPSLEFYGENMKKICFLEADIGIDPF